MLLTSYIAIILPFLNIPVSETDLHLQSQFHSAIALQAHDCWTSLINHHHTSGSIRVTNKQHDFRSQFSWRLLNTLHITDISRHTDRRAHSQITTQREVTICSDRLFINVHCLIS